MTSDTPVTELLRTPIGGTAAVVAALLCYGGLLVWARRPGHAVWMDALVGVAPLWSPALLYEGMRRRAR